MNNCKVVHETIIRDIMDLLDYVQDTEVEEILDKTKRSKLSTTSMARLSSNLTAVFPVPCTRNISVEAMNMVAKAIERKAVIMLQLVFSAYQMTDADNAEEFLSRFHKNIRLSGKMNIDDFINIMDDMDGINEVSDIRHSSMLKAVREDMKNVYFEFHSDIPDSIDRFSITNTVDGYSIKESAPTRPTRPTRTDDDDNGFTDGDARGIKDANDAFGKQLLNSDIKKANELVPSTMVLNLIHKDKDTGRTTRVENILIGVKARIVPVDSDDVITHILTKVNDRNWILQLIRATTREISFFKDFVFAIDKAKIDALSNSRRGSSNPIWKVLERRAMGGKLKRLMGKPNDVMAITTLVVSQEEVDYVRKEKNINFEDFRVISPVMDSYNLMGFVIIDESLELAKFLFDTGEAMWENLSFTSLERENSDNNYKKVINLLSKVSR